MEYEILGGLFIIFFVTVVPQAMSFKSRLLITLEYFWEWIKVNP